MNLVSRYLSQEISLFNHRLNLGLLLGTIASLALVTACALKRMWKPSPNPLSDQEFWQKIRQVKSLAVEGAPITVNNEKAFDNLAQGQLKMALFCKGQSAYVKDHLISSSPAGKVLDLGCGIGANSLPLYEKNWRVIAIDKQSEVIQVYEDSVSDIEQGRLLRTKPTCIVGDIVNAQYPENVDAVIAVDILPYISSSELQATLQKIHQALRPEGKFVGTLFFKRSEQDSLTTELMRKLGAHFYLGEKTAREIITRSGFEILKAGQREGSGKKQFYCLEFLAQKPKI